MTKFFKITVLPRASSFASNGNNIVSSHDISHALLAMTSKAHKLPLRETEPVTTNFRPLTQVVTVVTPPRGPGGTSYNGLYGEAPPERGTFFRLQV